MNKLRKSSYYISQILNIIYLNIVLFLGLGLYNLLENLSFFNSQPFYAFIIVLNLILVPMIFGDKLEPNHLES